MATHVMTETVVSTEANHLMHARVLSRATERLQAKYGATLDGQLVHRTVHAAYRELARTARLKTYLPTLAVNHAENRLRSLAATARAGTTPAIPADPVASTATPVAA